MPNIHVTASVKLGPNFDQQLRDGAMKELLYRIRRKLYPNRVRIGELIGDYLAGIFQQTDIARALSGDKAHCDLPAEMGLADAQAAILVSMMTELIRKSVTVKTVWPYGQNTDPIIVQILAVQKNWEQYIESCKPFSEYVSIKHGKDTQFTIPVLRWMLLDPNIDIWHAAYDIAYHQSGVSMKGSRSGRAVMLSLGALKDHGVSYRQGGYVLPELFQFVGGENFIEYTIGQESVAEEAMNIVWGVL